MTVLDASALLAYLFDEPGADIVESVLGDRPAIGCINLAETLTRLVDVGVDADAAWGTLAALPLEVVEADAPLAVETARLRPPTRSAGLSLGDRACLALGVRRREPVLTSDRAWMALAVDVEVHLNSLTRSGWLRRTRGRQERRHGSMPKISPDGVR